jgi:hypothetical protein
MGRKGRSNNSSSIEREYRGSELRGVYIHNEERNQYEEMWWMNVVVQFILYKQMKKKGERVYAVQLFSMNEVVKRENCVNFYVNGIHISTQCSLSI